MGGHPLIFALCVIEEAMHSDLDGIEFDWLASDTDGSIALFATAGEGFFPAPVATHPPCVRIVVASIEKEQRGR